MKQNKQNLENVLLVGFTASNSKDIPVLIVGKKDKDGLIDVLNAFTGEEAAELYKKLTTVVKRENI